MTDDWYDNPLFWRDNYSRMFTPPRMASAGDEIDRILELMGISPPGEVLDLCCGPGRHTVEFALKGFSAVGVDLTEEYLDEALRRAKERGVEIELVRSDMREFSRPESFDLAVNLFTSFGFFEDEEDDLRVLRNLRRSLRSGGRLVIELTGKEILARIFRERDWHRNGEMIFLEERELTDNWSRMINTWTILDRGGKRSEYRFTIRLYSARELMSAVESCGFREVKSYGSLAGDPYDEAAERLVVSAVK